jgi:hypothetical protein
MIGLAAVIFDDDLRKAFQTDLIYLGLSLADSAPTLALLVTHPKVGTFYYEELAKRNNNGFVPWEDDTLLASVIANGINELNYRTANYHWAKQGKDAKRSEKPKPPEPIMPPGYEPPKPKVIKKAIAVRDYIGGLTSSSVAHEVTH